jgi:nucleotide-binding universal stress UspA family protein
VAAELAQAATQVVIESGRPQTRLPELSRHHVADLVALGTGSRSSLGYALLGSFAQHVLRDALSDVLVVPARER